MTTLSNGAASIVPDSVDGYRSAREAQTVAHRIIGRAARDYSLAPAALRAGSLELTFDDEAAAYAAELALSVPGVWTLTPDVGELATIGMRFVVFGGAIARELERETGSAWLLSVPFEEIAG